MSQPKWKFIANLGDKHPIEHGGYFIFEDTTGVYPPEGELLVEPEEDIDDPDARWEVRRFILEPCTFINDILSDNKFHPELPAWFAKPESERARRPQDTTYLKDIAVFAGIPVVELISWFLSVNIVERARAWQLVGDYHGFDNLDQYPLYLTLEAVKRRYAEII